MTAARAATALERAATPDGEEAHRRSEWLAGLAVRWLSRAQELGAFSDPANRKDLNSPEFRALATRPDFQLRVMDPMFPADAFARGD
jgi:hypothetical protein